MLKRHTPRSDSARVIVLGLLAHAPYGGMTWQVLHHLEGLRRLGFDVWYVEDSDAPIVSPSTLSPTDDVGPNVAHVRRFMEQLGLDDRWVFRPPGSKDVAMGALDTAGLRQLYAGSDAVLNLCGSHEVRDDHRETARLILVETDPVRLQVDVAMGNESTKAYLDAFDYHFTYGANFGAPDCRVPVGGYDWQPTRPPVVVDWWRPSNGLREGAAITTVANWNTKGNNVVWRGETWNWSKRSNFVRFIDAPSRLPYPLEIAVVGAEEDIAEIRSSGWRVIPATDLLDPAAYRQYIIESIAEFSVAKQQYVAPRSGWFSDRTVCYLAAGRPAIIQETGFSNSIPAGVGILSFEDEQGLSSAGDSLANDYARHALSAMELAHSYFSAETVLASMMRRVGLL